MVINMNYVRYEAVLQAAATIMSGRTFSNDRAYNEELNRALRAVSMSMQQANITIVYIQRIEEHEPE